MVPFGYNALQLLQTVFSPQSKLAETQSHSIGLRFIGEHPDVKPPRMIRSGVGPMTLICAIGSVVKDVFSDIIEYGLYFI